MSCNICQPELLAKILKGATQKISQSEKSENCPICKSPPRLKTFQIAYNLYVAPHFTKPKKKLTALVVSGAQCEQEIIAKNFGNLVSTSLYGEYGPNTIKSDLRDLKEFKDSQFDYVSACNVLDYIFEIDRAFASVFRVLKPNGIFLFHIAEFRLVDGNVPPRIEGSKKEPYYPEGITVPSVIFGKQSILKKLRENRFKASMYIIKDIFSEQVCTWFLGKKQK